MPFKPVDTAIKVIIGPCIDDTNFKDREEALTYNQAGMEIDAIMEKADGTIVTTAITPTTAGDYDWTHTDQGYYELELPASAGASFNNTEEGQLTIVGFCTGVLPFRSVTYDIVPVNTFNSLIRGTDLLDVSVEQLQGVAQSLTDLKDFADAGYDPATNKVEGVKLVDTTTTNTDMITEAQVNAQADLALSDINLDHLLKVAVADGDVTNDSVIAQLADDTVPAVWANYNNAQQSLAATNDNIGADGTGLTELGGMSAGMKAQVNAEVDTALSDIGLHYLVATSVIGTDVADDSIIASMVSKSGTADWDSFVNTDDSLQAIRDRGDVAWITGAGGDANAIADATASRVWDSARSDYIIVGSFGEHVNADVVQLGGDTQSATDLKDFADAGYDPATNKVEGVKLVDTTTTNTDMRGTDGALLAANVNVTGGVVEANIEQIQDGVQSATDLKDFVDAGYDPATNKVEGVKLVDTTTTNTDMVGTDGALLAANVNVTGGVVEANIEQIQDTVQSATDLKDFVDAGYDPATNKVEGVKLVDTTTTNTDMRGTDGALLAANVNVTGGVVEANIEQIQDDVQSATDLKDFVDAGYDPATNKVEGVKLVDTTTTNTDMRGTDGANTVVPMTAALSQTEHDDTQSAITGLNNISTAQVNAEVDTALSDIGLHYLVATSVTGTDVADDSIIASMVSKSGTADWDSFVNTDDSLQAIRDRGDTDWITGTASDPNTIADATASRVWDSARSDYVIVGSFGEYVNANVVEWNGISVTGNGDWNELQTDVDYIYANVDQTLSGTESNIRGSDSDDLKSISDQLDAIGTVSGGALNFPSEDDNVGGAIKGVTFVGTEIGGTTWANTANEDGVYHDIDDVGAGDLIDIVYQIDIGGGRSASEIIWKGYLNSGNDTANIQAYNGSTWDTVATITGKNGSINDSINALLLATHTGTGADLGKIYVRITTVGGSNPSLHTDQLVISAVNIGQTVGYQNGAVWIDTVNGVAGTESFVHGVADNPVLSYADAVTIASNVGLHRFIIIAGSAITLANGHDNDAFIGSGGQWTLHLGTQSIAGAYFESADVDGTGSGASAPTFRNCSMLANVSIPPSFIDNCGFNTPSGSPMTSNGSGQFLFTECMSLVAGTGSPYFDFTGEGADVGINVRGWKGGAHFTLDSDCTISHEVYAGGSQTFVTNGAKIELRGLYRSSNFALTGASEIQQIGVCGPVTISGTASGGYVRLYGVSESLTDTSSGSTITNNTVKSAQWGDIQDIGTGTTLADSLYVMAGDGFVTTTDSLKEIRDRGDVAWITGTGADANTIADATASRVWDSARSDYVIAGSFGEYVNANVQRWQGTIVTGDGDWLTDIAPLVGDVADNNTYIGTTYNNTISHGDSNWETADVSGLATTTYIGTTYNDTISHGDVNWVTGTASDPEIVADAVATRVWDSARSDYVIVGSFGEYVNANVQRWQGTIVTGDGDWSELQTDVDAIRVATDTTIPAQITSEHGTINTNIDANETKIDAVKVDTAAILVDTADMQPKLGTIQDIGTGTTIGDSLYAIAGDGFVTGTDSLKEIRDRGDVAWITGTASDPNTVADAVATRVWDSARSDYVLVGSFGEYVNANVQRWQGTIVTGDGDWSTDVTPLVGDVADNNTYIGTTYNNTISHGDGNWTTAVVSGLATEAYIGTTYNDTITHGDGNWTTADVSALALETSVNANNTYIGTTYNDTIAHGDGNWTTADVSALALETSVNANNTYIGTTYNNTISHGDGNWTTADVSALATEANATTNYVNTISHGDINWISASVTGVAEAVWDAQRSLYVETGSFGEYVNANVQHWDGNDVTGDGDFSSLALETSVNANNTYIGTTYNDTISHGDGNWTTADVSALALETSVNANNTYIGTTYNDTISHGDGNWTTADVSALALETSVNANNTYIGTNYNNTITHGDNNWLSASVTGVAEAVWDAQRSQYVNVGSFGEYVNANVQRWQGTIVTGDGDWEELQNSVDSISGSTIADTVATRVWDSARNDYIVAGSFGEYVNANVERWNGSEVTGNGDLTSIENSINTVAGDSATLVWDSVRTDYIKAGTFGEYVNANVSVSGIADQVWDEARSGHTTTGSFGEYVNANTRYISDNEAQAEKLAQAMRGTIHGYIYGATGSATLLSVKQLTNDINHGGSANLNVANLLKNRVLTFRTGYLEGQTVGIRAQAASGSDPISLTVTSISGFGSLSMNDEFVIT